MGDYLIQYIYMQDSSSVSFTNLSYVAFQSVLEVVIVSFPGFWIARLGLLPKKEQKMISRLNADLFTPCLIFSKLAKSFSMAKMFEIAIIPVFYAVSTGISFLSGKVMAVILNLDVDETNFVLGNSVFGNSNSLPVSLTISLAYSLPNLEWDQIANDTKDSIASRGILYLLIWQQIGQVLRWTWGYNKLMKWSGESNNINRCMYSGSDTETEDNEGGTYEGVNWSSNVAFSNSVSLLGRVNHKVGVALWKFKSFMNPPLYAMLFSVVVASIHPLQHELFHTNGFINNTFSRAINELGSLSVPLILIVLGANLYPSGDQQEKSYNYNKIVFASIVGRMILPSCFLLPLIAICVKFLNVSILDDPIFLIVGFILTVSPPAIQLTQITQLNGFFESEMSGVLFWGYVILSLPVTIIVVSASILVLKWAEH